MPILRLPRQYPGFRYKAHGVIAVFFVTIIVTVLAKALHSILDISAITMIYLVVVLWSALSFGFTSALVAATISSLATNFFFHEPYYAFGLYTVQDAITLGVFLLTALTTSDLAANVREQSELHRIHADLALAKSKELSTLIATSSELAQVNRLADLERVVNLNVAGILEQPLALILLGSDPPKHGLLDLEAEALEEALKTSTPTGFGTPMYASLGVTIAPLVAHHGTIGALCFNCQNLKNSDQHNMPLMLSIAEQVAMAAERVKLSEEITEARVLVDVERLRSALLASITHDFNTPLGSIIGATSSLLSREAHFSEDAKNEQLSTILATAERLRRYIRNLLDVTSLEAGLTPHFDWVDLADVVGTSVGLANKVLIANKVSITASPAIPLLWLDAPLIERVFTNLLENAAKFAEPDSAIEINLGRRNGFVVVNVTNYGKVPNAEDIPKIFDKFYRGKNAGVARGAGLGLSICRSFMKAHNGTIEAEILPDGKGMMFTLTFPVREDTPALDMLDD
jgi:two-component system sensor histidine kinase KdpD